MLGLTPAESVVASFSFQCSDSRFDAGELAPSALPLFNDALTTYLGDFADPLSEPREAFETASKLASGAQDADDVVLALRGLMQVVGDDHSYVLPPGQTLPLRPVLATRAPEFVLRTDGTAVVRLHAVDTTSDAQALAWAMALHDGIADLASRHPRAWIVDLRDHEGDSPWPAFAALSTLLDGPAVGAYVSRRDNRPWIADRGASRIAGSAALVDVQAAPAPPFRGPVAVLIGPGTRNAGEDLAVAFRGRAHTRFFGAPTAGFPTGGVREHRLASGILLGVLEVRDADRTGVVHRQPLEPTRCCRRTAWARSCRKTSSSGCWTSGPRSAASSVRGSERRASESGPSALQRDRKGLQRDAVHAAQQSRARSWPQGPRVKNSLLMTFSCRRKTGHEHILLHQHRSGAANLPARVARPRHVARATVRFVRAPGVAGVPVADRRHQPDRRPPPVVQGRGGVGRLAETPRKFAFCTHAIQSDELMEVPDTRDDDVRFAANPFVRDEPCVRFYAGAPLILPTGERIGTLCVLDQHVRRLTEAQRSMLVSLANLVTQALTMRRDLIDRALAVRTEADAALAAREAELEDLYTNAPSGYYSLDGDGRFVRINDAALRWLGCSREEVCGKLAIVDFMDAEGRQYFHARFPRLKRDGRIFDIEYDLISRSGMRRRVLGSASALYGADGKFLMTRTVIHDISELHRTRESLRRLGAEQQTIIDTDLVGIVKLKNRAVAWANRGAERMFGWSLMEVIGQSSRMFYPDDVSFQHFGDEVYPLLHAGGVHRCQIQMARKDGSTLAVDMSLTVLPGQPGDVLCVLQDITELKRAEDARIRANAVEAENRSWWRRHGSRACSCPTCRTSSTRRSTRSSAIRICWALARSRPSRRASPNTWATSAPAARSCFHWCNPCWRSPMPSRAVSTCVRNAWSWPACWLAWSRSRNPMARPEASR